jgi:hypothetical protein
MGLLGRRKTPINAREFGTWDWWGDDNEWKISFNNRLSQTIGMSVDHLAWSIGEHDQYTDFPANPTDGKRIKISGMAAPGDDYRWYATIQGGDGRHYFFHKIDALLSVSQRVKYEPRDPDEINRIPFEAFGHIPDSPMHRQDALVSDSDPMGRSESPVLELTDMEYMAPFADFSSSDYDELCFYIFGESKPWEEAVIKELKRRHQLGTLDIEELNGSVKRYIDLVKKRNDAIDRQLVSKIEARLRKAHGYGFDPPGGWGALGAD